MMGIEHIYYDGILQDLQIGAIIFGIVVSIVVSFICMSLAGKIKK